MAFQSLNTCSGLCDHTSVAEYLEGIREWYDENDNDCGIDVTESDKLILIQYCHYAFDDGDTTTAIVKADLTPEELSELQQGLEEFTS